MRNLKKILALVLALVMSLSLMATASAAETTATGSADYTTAQQVLEGLKVFQGYDAAGTMNYDQPVTRVQTAALVYRIATADVDDVQKDMYTNNPFQDVAQTYWGNGYISYGYNAEILKGYSKDKFGPDDQVTGYQVLAMALRTLGYGKNNEFQGANWEIQTAATAKQQHLLDGVTAADEARLGQSAPRGLVAQILFNTLLQKTVKYSALHPYNYEPDADTLGYQKFKLEEITGVVTANEYADLNADTPQAAGKTVLKTAAGSRTLNVTSYFSNIGEENSAYIVPATQSTYKVLCGKLFPSTIDKADNAYDKNTAADLAKGMNVKLDDDKTEYYINFDPAKVLYANIRLSYYVENTTTIEKNYESFLENLAAPYKTGNDVRVTIHKNDAGAVTGYTRIILAGEEVKAEDQAIMQYIFDYANLAGTYLDLNADVVVRGEVYVGTQSKVDVSDTISYEDFKAARMDLEDARDGKAANGEYIKVIDNDRDGIADYVLKTQYVLDEVVNVTKETPYYRYIKDGSVKYEANGGEVYADADVAKSLSVGSVILSTAKIDGTYYAEVADPVNVTVQTVVYATPKITTTTGDEYLESGIINGTVMDTKIAYMDEKISYNLYLDKGGHIRAYKTGEASKYGLLTEMYPTNDYNGAHVTRGSWIVELMGYNDAKPVEYNVLNSYTNGNWAQTVENPFIDNMRTERWNMSGVLRHYDYLQEAIEHLGWNRTEHGDDRWESGYGNEFVWDYNGDRQSWTNVGRYITDENGVYLYSASERAYSASTHELMYYGSYAAGHVRTTKTYESQWKADYQKANPLATDADAQWKAWSEEAAELNQIVYAVDYVQLQPENIVAGNSARLYHRVDTNDDTEKVVYAVNDTQYYLVTNDNIRTFTGYNNVPTIDRSDIRAIYTVAENTTANNASKDYWVADVIVIELAADYNYESVSLIYNNPSQTINQVRTLETLNSKADGVKQNIRPENYVWGNQWGDVGYEYNYGFYGLTGTAAVEGETNTVSAKISPIGSHYNRNGIYAGTVTAIADLSNGGYYIGVDKHTVQGTAVTDDSITVYSTANGSVPVYAIGKSTSGKGYTAKELVIDPSGVMADRLVEGHKIVWVERAEDDVAYIVDVTHSAKDWTNAFWMYSTTEHNEWSEIMDEQNAAAPVIPEVDKSEALNDLAKVYNETLNTAPADKKGNVYDEYIKAMNNVLAATTEAAVNEAWKNGVEAIKAAGTENEPKTPAKAAEEAEAALTTIKDTAVTNAGGAETEKGQAVIAEYDRIMGEIQEVLEDETMTDADKVAEIERLQTEGTTSIPNAGPKEGVVAVTATVQISTLNPMNAWEGTKDYEIKTEGDTKFITVLQEELGKYIGAWTLTVDGENTINEVTNEAGLVIGWNISITDEESLTIAANVTLGWKPTTPPESERMRSARTLAGEEPLWLVGQVMLPEGQKPDSTGKWDGANVPESFDIQWKYMEIDHSYDDIPGIVVWFLYATVDEAEYEALTGPLDATPKYTDDKVIITLTDAAKAAGATYAVDGGDATDADSEGQTGTVIAVTVPDETTGKVVITINGTEFEGKTCTYTVKPTDNETVEIDVTITDEPEDIYVTVTATGDNIQVAETKIKVVDGAATITANAKGDYRPTTEAEGWTFIQDKDATAPEGFDTVWTATKTGLTAAEEVAVTETTDELPTATVTFQKVNPVPTGVTIDFYTKNGDKYTKIDKTYQQFTDVELGDPVTIYVKVDKASAPTEKWTPVVVEDSLIAFSKVEDTDYWTATVKTAVVGTIYTVTAKQYTTATFTFGDGITPVSPAADEDGVVTAQAVLDAATSKYVAQVIVDVAADRVPVFTEAATVGGGYTQVGNLTQKPEQMDEETYDNRWVLTFGGILGTESLQGEITASSASDVTLTSLTPGVVKVDGNGKFVVKDGTIESAKLYAREGKQPKLNLPVGAKADMTLVGPVEDNEELEGWNEWTVKITGLTTGLTVTIENEDIPTFAVTYTNENPGGGAVQFVVLPTDAGKTPIPGGTGTLNIWVKEGRVPKTNASDPKLAFEATGKKDINKDGGSDGAYWYEYKMTITKGATQSSKVLETVASNELTILAAAGSGITPLEQTISTDAAGKASFKVKVDKGLMPLINTAVEPNQTTLSGANVAYKYDEATDEWTVSLDTVTAAGRVVVSTRLLPRVSVMLDGTGITLDDDEIYAYLNDAGDRYEATIKFTLDKNSALSSNAVSVDDTTNYTFTTPVEIVAGSGKYQFTLSVDKGTAETDGNLIVHIKSGATVEVTLKLGEHMSEAAGETYTKTVAKGGDAEFIVTVEDNWKIVDKANAYNAEKVDGDGNDYKVTVINAQAGEVEVVATEAMPNRYDLAVTLDADSGVTDKFTITYGLAGATPTPIAATGSIKIVEDTVITIVTKADDGVGFVPELTLTSPTADDGKSKITMTPKFEGDLGATGDKSYVTWTYTLTGVTESADLKIEAKAIMGGAALLNGTEKTDVTYTSTKGEDFTDKKIVAKYTDEEGTKQNPNASDGPDSYTLVVLVANGYEINGQSTEYTGTVVEAVEGYTAYQISVTNAKNDTGAALPELVINVAAA